MRAMFWKECRELLPAAVSSCLVVAMYCGYTAWNALGHINLNDYQYPDAVYNIAPCLVVLAPLAALLIGFLQIVPEMRRDRWSFLVHRPATRTLLFWGKVLPGLMLYLAATALPYYGSIWWIVRHMKMLVPFDIGMTEAGVANILAGALFYFAAMLVAIRPARWYGGRALPLVAALVVAFVVYGTELFWLSALCTITIAAIFAVAAWGSFLTEGHYREQPRITRLALAAVLSAGIYILGFFAVVLMDTDATLWAQRLGM